MSRTLYDISERYRGLWELCLDDAVDLDKLENALKSVEGEIEEKVSNGIGLIQSLKNAADGMENEEKRLKESRRVLENKIQRIKNYYLDELSLMGKKKVLTNRGTMSICQNGGKLPLKIDDESLIPENYFKYVPAIDKESLRDALMNGEKIAGAHLEERGRYLRIA